MTIQIAKDQALGAKPQLAATTGLDPNWPERLRLARQGARYQSIVSLIAVCIFVSMPYWFLRLFDYDPEEIPVVFIVTLVVANILLVLAVTQKDSFLRKAMLVGLGVKLAAASLYLNVAAILYGWSIDAYQYVNDGSTWAELIKSGVTPHLDPVWGTNFVTFLSALVEIFVGRSFSGLFVAFSLVAFWGQYFLWRAFAVAFTRGNRRLAAIFLFFIPSIAYWTAMVGKDALLALSGGLCAFGLAQLLRRLSVGGFAAMTLGLGLAFMTRPHMAALFAVAATLALALGANLTGVAGVATRVIVLVAVVVITIYFATQASQIWQVNDFDQGLARVQQSSQDTLTGGSGFQQSGSMAFRVVVAPLLIFRPFLWEATSIQAALAALEGMFFLILTWRSRGLLRWVVLNWRSNPFFVFILAFSFEFIFGVATAISNFGLLVRQRVMILPFFVMLCCVTREREVSAAQQPVQSVNPNMMPPALNAPMPEFAFPKRGIPRP